MSDHSTSSSGRPAANPGGMSRQALTSSATVGAKVDRQEAHRVAAQVMRTVSPDLHEASNIRRFADYLMEHATEIRREPRKMQELSEPIKKRLEYVKKVGEARENVELVEQAVHDFQKVAEAARQHVTLVAQISCDVARVKRHRQLLTYWSDTFQSQMARDHLVKLAPKLQTMEATYHAEKRWARDYLTILVDEKSRFIQRPVIGSAERVGKAMLAVERKLRQNPVGRRLLATGRVLTNENVFRGLDTVGALADAFSAHEESAAKTSTGKLVNGELAGWMSLGANRGGLTAADPLLGRAFGKENTVGTFYRGVSDVLSAFVDVSCKHDSTALSEVHQKSMSGKYGTVLKGYSMIGDAMSKSNWVDNKLSWAADRMNGVPKDVRTSLVWWASH